MQENDKEMCLAQKVRISAIVERFIRTLKKEDYKYMTSLSKNGYIDNLADIVNKYNNTYQHNQIKTC